MRRSPASPCQAAHGVPPVVEVSPRDRPAWSVDGGGGGSRHGRGAGMGIGGDGGCDEGGPGGGGGHCCARSGGAGRAGGSVGRVVAGEGRREWGSGGGRGKERRADGGRGAPRLSPPARPLRRQAGHTDVSFAPVRAFPSCGCLSGTRFRPRWGAAAQPTPLQVMGFRYCEGLPTVPGVGEPGGAAATTASHVVRGEQVVL